MATLELSINCLCLFVPDKTANTVHVLMPATNGHHRHVARVLFKGSPATGRSMEGWALEVGGTVGAANTALALAAPPHGEEIVDLNALTGRRLDWALVRDLHHPRVVSRIVLRAGALKEMRSEARWTLGGRPQAMATQVVWRVEDLADDQLSCTPLRARPRDVPIRQPLSRLRPTAGVVHLDVFHVTERSLPPRNAGTLRPREVQDHFRAFYELYGISSPAPAQLPSRPERIGGLPAFAAAMKGDTRHAQPHVQRLARSFERVASKAGIPQFRESETYNCPTAKGE